MSMHMRQKRLSDCNGGLRTTVHFVGKPLDVGGESAKHVGSWLDMDVGGVTGTKFVV